MPPDALSEPGRSGGDEGRPEPQVDEQEGLNVGYLAYNTTAGALRQARGPQGAEHGDQQAGHRRRRLPGRGPSPRTRSRRPCGPTTTPSRTTPTIRKPPRKMLEAAGVKDLSMKIWAMPVQRPYMPNARRAAELMQADLAKVGVKVEIVSYEWGEYLESRRPRPRRRGHPGLDRRQWRPGQLPDTLLGCDAGRRRQPRAMVQRGVRSS
jgi:dipeptide transport system substrate-binding protein